jgi:CheY-like chemotaxis protein
MLLTDLHMPQMDGRIVSLIINALR